MLKVSVVTVCYNAVASIEQTILSVLNQTYTNIEYIIIDGGSTDGTTDIIKKYEIQLAYWISEPDNGIYDAMNKGIAAATGDYINFMNAGDTFYSSNTIQTILSTSNEESVIYGNICRCYKLVRQTARGITVPQPRLIDFIDDTIHHQAAFIKRALFLKYGNYSTTYQLISDWLFFFESIYINGESTKYINLCVAYFKMDGISSRCTDRYTEERRMYLTSKYGKELYDYVLELKSHKSSWISRNWILIKTTILNSTYYSRIKLYLKQKI